MMNQERNEQSLPAFSLTFHADLHRALVSRRFLAGTLGMALVLILASMESLARMLNSGGLLPPGFHGSLLQLSLQSEGMRMALPVLCTLPYAVGWLEDGTSGYRKFFLSRTNRSSYLVSKALACQISGGLIPFSGTFAAYTILALLLCPLEVAAADMVGIWQNMAELIKLSFFYFFPGAFWAMAGMLFASLTSSRYMAYASPFIFYYTLVILYERYFDALPWIYPVEWMAPSDAWPLRRGGVILWLAALSLLVTAIFFLTAERRMGNE